MNPSRQAIEPMIFPMISSINFSTLQLEETTMGQFSLFDTEEFVKDEVFLFFDTETNGLPYNYDAPVTEVDNWPRMIQLAWVQHDAHQKELSRGDHLIYPDNFHIHDSIHGI